MPPTLLSGLLVVALLALPFLRRWLERPAAAPAATDPPGVLQLAWLAGGAERALDVAMTRLLGLGALGVLSTTTPIRLWPFVVAFGVTALVEWHLGWWTTRGGDA